MYSYNNYSSVVDSVNILYNFYRQQKWLYVWTAFTDGASQEHQYRRNWKVMPHGGRDRPFVAGFMWPSPTSTILWDHKKWKVPGEHCSLFIPQFLEEEGFLVTWPQQLFCRSFRSTIIFLPFQIEYLMATTGGCTCRGAGVAPQKMEKILVLWDAISLMKGGGGGGMTLSAPPINLAMCGTS